MVHFKTICIIDDDPIHIFTTKRNLLNAELSDSILVLKNGKDAFEKLNEIFLNGEDLPDVILLDVNMPIWDGWDFLDAFTQLKITKKILIFLVTSSNNPTDHLKSQKYNNVINNFIIKPFDMKKLKEVLLPYEE